MGKMMQRQFKKTKLALLYTCEAATGDGSLPDDVVHLVIGPLLAKYQTFINTMWPIGDQDASLKVQKIYEHLLK